MADQVTSISNGVESPARKRRKVLRPPVQRRKTGCMTCRKRKKRCDEGRPICGNCERANFECGPCPPKKPCPSGKKKHGVTHSPEQTHNTNGENSLSPVDDHDRNEAHLGENWSTAIAQICSTSTSESPDWTTRLSPFNHFPSSDLVGFSFAAPPMQHQAVEESLYDDSVETMFTPLGQPQHAQSSCDLGSTYFFGSLDDWNQTFSGTSLQSIGLPNMQQLANFVPPTPPPTSLAFPIPGIDTKLRQRMFYHFHTVMANILTTNSEGSNPMNEVLIPLALEDPIVMDTLLSLSGSHILKLEGQVGNGHVEDRPLRAEKQRLLRGAYDLQLRRTDELLSSDSRPCFRSSKNREDVFATWLLLCLHEITEGNSDRASQKYLDKARQVITSGNADFASGGQVALQIHPFLIEFFLYHMCLALVTMPSFLESQDSINNLAALLGHNKAMVGGIEMLLDFIKRIATIRQQINEEGHLPGTAIIDAFEIHQDLERWRPDLSLSNDQVHLAEFYRKALSIWLFSITRPTEKANHQIQDIVRELTTKMSTISDSVKACLLFPLFMVGGAAISREDREVVERLFVELRNWSALGNVDLTFRVVRGMWRDYDEGVPKAWDWTMQLEKKSMGLLVT